MREARVRAQSGFTLVELLIVVIILAILAAIVVPQFASTTSDAEDSAVKANLQAVRAAIEFYKQQHGHLPASVAATGATCGAGVAGTGAINTEQAFIEHMTKFSQKDGKACTGTDGTLLGPYLTEMPGNPKVTTVANQKKVTMSTAGVLDASPNDGSTGWWYDVKTGQFLTNN